MNRPPTERVATLIELAYTCEAFNTLPGPGGLLDQDWYLVEGLRMVKLAQAERAEVESKRNEAQSQVKVRKR